MSNNKSNDFKVNSALKNKSGTLSIKFDMHVVPLMYVGYGIIFLVSLFGNSLIIHIIRTNSAMKTAINYLVLNQACADLFFTIMCFLNVIRETSYQGLWFGGNIGNITCKLFLGILYVLTGFSIWLLVTIAIDRLYAITHPLQRSPISRNLKKVILILWTWAIVTSVNIFDKTVVQKIEESYFCKALTTVLRKRWTIFNFLIFAMNGLLPLTLLACLYTRICIKLWTRQVPGDGANQNQQRAATLASAFKVTRMMIALFSLFLVCWLPWIITMTLFLFSPLDYNHWFIFPMWLTFVYSGLNPYVYFSFSSNFRQGLKLLLANICAISFRSQSIELQQN